MNSFFKKLLLKRDTLSRLENQVLNYFLEKPEMIETHTLDELAKQMYVSTATISRTCKKLGFSGFQELKYALLQHRQEYEPLETDVNGEDNQNKSLAGHIQRFEQEMQMNLQTFPKRINKEIIQAISESRYVEFFGVGNSWSLGADAARKLTFAGRLASARSDWDELRVVAGLLGPQDLAIVISLSGETLHIIEYANILHQNQVPTLAIVGREHSHLEELASMTLLAHIESFYYGEIDMSSRFPFNLILDLLVHEYLKEKQEN